MNDKIIQRKLVKIICECCGNESSIQKQVLNSVPNAKSIGMKTNEKDSIG